MSRRVIHWSKEGVRGPELLAHLPAIVPQALDGLTPMTATVMTLGMLVAPEEHARWTEVAQEIAETHPARILLLSSSRDSGDEDSLDVDVHAAVDEQRGPGRPPLLFSECIAMTLHGRIANYWIDWVQALVRPDLPSYLWWMTPPSDRHFRWDLLSTTFQSLLIDSQSHSLADWLPLLEASLRYRIGVWDLDWTRGGPFRHLLAQAADEPEARSVLHEPDRIVVTSPNENHWPLASSWLWLSWKLGWGLSLPPCHHPSIEVQQARGRASWAFHRGDWAVTLEELESLWVLHLVQGDRSVRTWQAPRSATTLAGDVLRLLSEGRQTLYHETLKHTLLERTLH